MEHAKFTFLDCDNVQHVITYRLANTPLTDRWIDLVEQNQRRQNNTLNGVFSNRILDDVPELTNTITALVKNINLEYDQLLPVYDVLDREKLNYLHEFFELFGKRLETEGFSETLIQNFDQLNNLIHNCEHAMFNSPDKFGVFGLVFDMYPREIYENLLEEHKLMMRSEMLWGKIYLGYNTLGKDWLQVMRYGDLDIIERDSVAPQTRFAAELWMNFSRDYEAGWWQQEFYKKVKTYPPEIQKKIPLDNLNRLALGRYLIGNVVIDDTFLSFDGNPDHWKINNHPCKSLWNRQVFRKFRQIVDFKLA
jgi:hypothetical protein